MTRLIASWPTWTMPPRYVTASWPTCPTMTDKPTAKPRQPIRCDRLMADLPDDDALDRIFADMDAMNAPPLDRLWREIRLRYDPPHL